MIDHEDIDGTFGRFQFEPQLLLQGLRGTLVPRSAGRESGG